MKAAQYSLYAIVVVLFGGLMLAAGDSIIRSLIFPTGFLVPAIAANRVFARARERQGKADDFSLTMADLANISRTDVCWLVLSPVFGLGLSLTALLAFRDGA